MVHWIMFLDYFRKDIGSFNVDKYTEWCKHRFRK